MNTQDRTAGKVKEGMAYDIHPLIRQRFSPRAFSGEALNDRELHRLFEAVRWAPSSYNDQPWSFIIARPQEDAFDVILNLLSEGNRSWAAKAGLLGMAIAREHFSRNGKPNRHAWHDMGQALAYLTFQATALDLYVHQMAGFSPERTRQQFDLPEAYAPVTAFAVGRLGDPEDLPENYRSSETAAQRRKAQEAFVFHGHWEADA